MQDNQKKTEQQSPADIAREAFRRLAARRIAPTPDAYREIYEEIAGARAHSPAEKVLADIASTLRNAPGDAAVVGARLSRSMEARDWQQYRKHLHQLLEKHHSPPAPAARSNHMPLVDDPAPLPSAKMTIPLVDEPAPPPTFSGSVPLVDIVEAPPKTGTNESMDQGVTSAGGRQARKLREMLVRTLKLAVASLAHNAPELVAESEKLAEAIDAARTEQTLAEIEARLKQFCFKVELKSADMAEEQELLLRLFRLLLDNVSELLEDDSWLSGQVASVQQLLSGPINYASLTDAGRSLKEVIYKQGVLKHSLSEAKLTLKNMMLTFIDRLGDVATSTGNYHGKIEKFSEQVSQAKDIGQLNNILGQVMHETRIVQMEALRSRDQMVAARREVQEAEARVHELESQLAELSELVREDQLTGSLNRRGLDDVLEREVARSERRHSPLCIAMLDLDDFKRLNDTYGHSAGDQALIHLVRVVKETLRALDVIARFGGEEFIIVLPDTGMEEATQTVTRVQRELTKRIFMHNHEKLLITFSAGVALRRNDEDQAAFIQRADQALYQAKKAGKNRVVAAL